MISVNQLSVSIGSAKLLDDINVEIQTGKLNICVGRNGVGKSTLLKAICGDLPASGTVFYNEEPKSELSNDMLATQRAVVPQHSRLSFDFTAQEVVLMGRIPHTSGFESSHDYEIADQCMQKVGVTHLKNRSFPTLSGGEQQRVRLAAALAQIWDSIVDNRPTYLLLDEPTSSLDLAHQHQILNLLREIADQGVTVFAIVHDLNMAAQYAHHVVLLKNGKLLNSGHPQKIFQVALLEQAFECAIEVISHPRHQCPLVLASQKQNSPIH